MRHTNTLILNADCQPKNMLPLSATSWQEAIKAVWSGSASVMHEYDDWEVHSPRLTVRVPSVIILTKYVPLKRYATMSKDNLFMRDDHTCQYCAKVFPGSMLTFDHVHPQSKGGGTNWENIVAACSPCNNKRGNNSSIRPMREPYKPSYWEMVEKRKKYPLWVSDESWIPYLDWPEDLIRIPTRKVS